VPCLDGSGRGSVPSTRVQVDNALGSGSTFGVSRALLNLGDTGYVPTAGRRGGKTHDWRKNSSSWEIVGRSIGCWPQHSFMILHNPSWRSVAGRPGCFPFSISNIAAWKLITKGGPPVNVCSKMGEVRDLELPSRGPPYEPQLQPSQT